MHEMLAESSASLGFHEGWSTLRKARDRQDVRIFHISHIALVTDPMVQSTHSYHSCARTIRRGLSGKNILLSYPSFLLVYTTGVRLLPLTLSRKFGLR